MTADLVVRVLGVPIGISTRDDEETARLRHQWARCLCEDEPVDTVDRAGTGEDDVGGDYSLASAVTMRALRQTAGERLNLHAGGVADEQGRLLAVVGPSGTGKTTAIRRLAERLQYLSDETVSLTPHGPPYTAFPHAKPLSVITDPAQPRRKEQQSPDDLGLGPTPESAVLARLVLLRRAAAREEEYAEHALAVVPLAEGVCELIPQTSSLVQLEPPVLAAVELLRSVGGAVVLEYAEIDSHVDELVGLLAAELVSEDPDSEHAPGADPPPPPPGCWARAAWRDAVRLGDEVLVMLDSDVYRLSGLGAVLWWALDAPRSLPELVATAEQVIGAHPDAEALVEETLSSMSTTGLVWLGSPS